MKPGVLRCRVPGNVPCLPGKTSSGFPLFIPDVCCRNHVKTCRVVQGKSGYY
ncbi:rCG20180 [Rattus norvegicus]|uniref:RCG20180 n=1 Tax=Rattus norvegicus TaxID=10116 RepID=A6JGM8_RAT|nr:rCG20180 [Rattus norvegicus]